ncbi:hypothetical protein HDG41_004132 [Paraburkholderia sp. JPY162]|uniref:Uncharacterized protein n=1 Tax=Paraburkholderia youngii TaxID=2782701 RepID=A0A7W8P3B3_9BURK|nr:hypothetical protein [Paraburkholderia youngii]
MLTFFYCYAGKRPVPESGGRRRDIDHDAATPLVTQGHPLCRLLGAG